jgi:hypothetical protein
MVQYYVALDPGQTHDYSALVVVERRNIPTQTISYKQPGAYDIVHIHRFALKTSYPDVVSGVAELLASDSLKDKHKLVVDKTGTGAPVVDMLRQAGLKPIPVTITGGSSVTREEGSWRVPKRDLVTTIQVLLQSGRLRIAKDLPEASTLRDELLNFRIKVTLEGSQTYEPWRVNQNDDIILATSLACWYGERTGGQLPFDVPAVGHAEPRWPTFGPPQRIPDYWR